MIANYNFYNLLTAGNEYQILNSAGDSYFVECDNGDRMWIKKDFFESEHLNNAKRIADEASALAERERVRDNLLSNGIGWRIHGNGMMIESNNYEPNEYVKVLDQLREIMRVPEGESIVTHAKVLRALADALICLQK